MAARVKSGATYDDLVRLPENVIGELIGGELYASPRPGGPHARFTSALGMLIGSRYDIGIKGPGGWWILFEPELHLGADTLIPDLAGWRRERMPAIPDGHRGQGPQPNGVIPSGARNPLRREIPRSARDDTQDDTRIARRSKTLGSSSSKYVA